MMAPALEFDRVSRDFALPDGRLYRALDQISFAISAGSFVAIAGPSGCGKSTLLNIAAGLLTPSSGRVHVDGEPVDGLNRSATYMFQQDALLPWKTVRDNVALGLTLSGVTRAEAHARAGAWLARVGLAAFAAHYPSQLSGGMRKRVTMAQNWIIDRGMLLMDEPFSALDVHTRLRMETELLALWESRSADQPPPRLRRSAVASANAESLALQETGGQASQAGGDRETGGRAFQASRDRKTIVFVTHDLEEAIALADEVVVLSAGPAAHVVARHPVTLDRPRDLMELRTSEAFVDLYRALWVVLREEVIRSQRSAEATRA
ncbi:MAG: mannosyltransferase [Acidobacteria bacterium]|nr:MAG: mannosyltransferase [Acidobacteriota bacterium]